MGDVAVRNTLPISLTLFLAFSASLFSLIGLGDFSKTVKNVCKVHVNETDKVVKKKKRDRNTFTFEHFEMFLKVQGTFLYF